MHTKMSATHQRSTFEYVTARSAASAGRPSASQRLEFGLGFLMRENLQVYGDWFHGMGW